MEVEAERKDPEVIEVAKCKANQWDSIWHKRADFSELRALANLKIENASNIFIRQLKCLSGLV